MKQEGIVDVFGGLVVAFTGQRFLVASVNRTIAWVISLADGDSTRARTLRQGVNVQTVM